jgi:Fe2+ transport system protein B
MAAERYALSSKIAKDIVTIVTSPRISLEQKLATITTHKVFGYLILVGVVAAVFAVIFEGGNLLQAYLTLGLAGYRKHFQPAEHSFTTASSGLNC